MIIQELQPTFSDLFLGSLSSAEWAFQSLLMFLGILSNIAINIIKRKDTDKKPNFRYWISKSKNIAYLVFSLILMYFLIRFYGEYKESLVGFIPKKLSGSIYLVMIFLGFFQHKLVELASNLLVSQVKKVK